ncbi:MAG: helix-turn-helix transcriptional regulator [Blastocatellia bacterium]
MGRGRRARPKKLQEKVCEVRRRLGFTQDEMARRLIEHGAEETTHSGYVADFETGKRAPSLLGVLAYAKLFGVCADVLLDDEIDLPERLPSKAKHRK